MNSLNKYEQPVLLFVIWYVILKAFHAPKNEFAVYPPLKFLVLFITGFFLVDHYIRAITQVTQSIYYPITQSLDIVITKVYNLIEKESEVILLKFEHFLGTDLCDNLESIVQIMKKQNKNRFNEFWISIDKPFSLMAVLTSKSIAHVHFFDEDGSPGFSALSDCNLGLDIDKTCVFYTNTNEIIEVENEYILSIDRAIEIVQEFFITKQIPKCIEWDEL